MAYDTELAERIRRILRPHGNVSERKMFGGIAFMVGGNMACGVIHDELMVRVGSEPSSPRWPSRTRASWTSLTVRARAWCTSPSTASPRMRTSLAGSGGAPPTRGPFPRSRRRPRLEHDQPGTPPMGAHSRKLVNR